MAVKTTIQQLEAVQSAIENAEKFLSTGKGDKSLTQQRLDTLYKREDQLLSRYQAEQGTGGLAVNTGIPARKY